MNKITRKSTTQTWNLEGLNLTSLSRCKTQGLIIAEVYRETNELQDYSIHYSIKDVKTELQRLWDSYWFDCLECDWELDKLPNGFTNQYTDFLVMSPEEFHSNGWRME